MMLLAIKQKVQKYIKDCHNITNNLLFGKVVELQSKIINRNDYIEKQNNVIEKQSLQISLIEKALSNNVIKDEVQLTGDNQVDL